MRYLAVVGHKAPSLANDNRDIGDPLTGILPEQLACFRVGGEDRITDDQVACRRA